MRLTIIDGKSRTHITFYGCRAGKCDNRVRLEIFVGAEVCAVIEIGKVVAEDAAAALVYSERFDNILS
jgi:phosphoribosyl 1,2-cyclic phosphodiesterase